MKNKLTDYFKVIILATVLSIGGGYAFAQTWQGPGQNSPPNQPGVFPPINTSGVPQIKIGGISAYDLVAVKITAGDEFCLDFCIPTWNQASDAGLKTNLTAISENGLSALARVSALNGWFFNWNKTYEENFNSDSGRQIGLIAQDVEKVLPEVVSSVSRGGEEYKTVDYEKIVPLLVEAIKEQQSQIEKLKAEIESLKR